ncbi:MAG TPA: hypothetical protein DD490_13345, partial [Acidobacteria bacterium]|nr:hypothetical protein [Acidobacteriota bacterium]
SPLRRDPALQDEVAQLRRRVVELQQDARMNEVEIARLRQQVAELETQKTGARPAAPVNAPAPPPPAAPQPTPRPAPPRPAPVAPAPAPEAIEEEDLDVPQAAPSPSPTPAPVRPAAPAPAVAPAVDDAELLSLSAQALYDRGYTLFHQARYVDAEASFQRFLQNNPDSELADNAQYW